MSQIQWLAPEIPATWEAEAEEAQELEDAYKKSTKSRLKTKQHKSSQPQRYNCTVPLRTVLEQIYKNTK